jgi:hypothetical protein
MWPASGRQLGFGQHDHQPHGPAGQVLGRTDDVLLGRRFEILLVEGPGVERIVESRYPVES